MKYREAEVVVERVRENPELLLSEDYARVQCGGNWLIDLAVQMGPNCNRTCSHCYGGFGKHRKGLPSEGLVRKLLEDSLDAQLYTITLTDGEPMRLENKLVMGMFAEHSEKIPIAILTNGVFARTLDNATKWFEFLKDNGYDLGKEGNLIQVSTGPTYKVHTKNYARLNWALKETFPNVNPVQHLGYIYLGTNPESEEEKKGWDKLIQYVFNIFCRDDGKEGRVEGPKITDYGDSATYLYPVDSDKGIEIVYRFCDPDGGVSNFAVFGDEEVLKVEDLSFSPRTRSSLVVSSKGEVGFGDSQTCVGPAKIYGNVFEESLRRIKERIYDDPIYFANQLGSMRFLYSLAQEVDPSFVVRGRIKCDVCHEFYQRPGLVDAVRGKLKKQGIVKTFRDYISRELERVA